MFGNPSLMTRIAIGKTIGLIVGLIDFISLPYFSSEVSLIFRWGLLLWYTTVGAIIGMLGVFNWHPLLNLPLPWWFRAPYLGAWMNFVLTLFIYDQVQAIFVSIFGEDGFVSNPFWLVLEGALVGLLIGYFATRFGGEGKETLEDGGMSN